MSTKGNTVNVEVGKDEAKILLDFYIEQIRISYDRISELKHKIDELSMKAADLKRLIDSKVIVVDSTANGSRTQKALQKYQKTWPLYKKCIYALESNDRVMSTRELANFILQMEGEEVGGFEFLQKDIGATLYQKMASTSPRLVTRFKMEGSNEFLYGLPAWFNSDGSLKDDYKK